MGETISLGELLTNFRKALEKNQKQVANELDMPSSSLSFYENNNRIPPHQVLVKLLNYYNSRLTVESDIGKWTFKTTDDSIYLEKIPEDEELDLMAGLDPTEREDLINYIRRRKHRYKREIDWPF